MNIVRVSLYSLYLSLISIGYVSISASHAGEVVVRKSSEPFDAFAVRDQVLQDHQWREALRMQQQLTILRALPLGCVLVPTPYRYFHCGAHFYRPYRDGKSNNELYIEIDPPESSPN